MFRLPSGVQGAGSHRLKVHVGSFDSVNGVQQLFHLVHLKALQIRGIVTDSLATDLNGGTTTKTMTTT